MFGVSFDFSAVFFMLMICAAGVGLLCGILLGFDIGVRQTERRWSEAVARAEDSRKREARHTMSTLGLK